MIFWASRARVRRMGRVTDWPRRKNRSLRVRPVEDWAGFWFDRVRERESGSERKGEGKKRRKRESAMRRLSSRLFSFSSLENLNHNSPSTVTVILTFSPTFLPPLTHPFTSLTPNLVPTFKSTSPPNTFLAQSALTPISPGPTSTSLVQFPPHTPPVFPPFPPPPPPAPPVGFEAVC